MARGRYQNINCGPVSYKIVNEGEEETTRARVSHLRA